MFAKTASQIRNWLPLSLLGSLLWIVGASAAPTQLSINDVSVLLPLPASKADIQKMLKIQGTSANGKYALVDKRWLDGLPKPLVINRTDKETYESMSVIAFRFDSCYPWKSSSDCQPMIRASFQPVVREGAPIATTTVDASLHVFYLFDSAEFAALVKEWSKVVGKSPRKPSQPLGVHPLLEDRANSSSFKTAVSDFLIRNLTPTRIGRLTFMTLSGRTNVWDFGGFQRDDHDRVTEIVIPRVQSKVQTAKIHAQPPFNFDGGLDPSPKENGILNKFLETSERPGGAVADTRKKDILAATRVAHFLEAPSPESNPEKIDCASCHVAQSYRHWAQNMLGQADIPNEYFNYGKYPGVNFENKTVLTRITNQLRTFGYFGASLVVSRRVILESAETRAKLNALLGGSDR